jgi:hypothetical protein
MPEQDFATTYQRHEQAVDELVVSLLSVGMSQFLGNVGEPPELPPYSFARAPRRAVLPKLKVVPRDLVFRLDAETVSWKVYYAGDRETHSSLYRSVAYQVLTRPPYLQTVAGYQTAPIEWLEEIQGELDRHSPTGIRGEGEIIALIRDHLRPTS